MTTISIRASIMAGMGALALAGCTTAPPPEGGYRIDGQNAVRPTLDTVRVIDGALAGYRNAKYQVASVLDVENTTLSRTATNLPRISVELRNKASVAIPLQVRTSWYDADGRPIDMASSWTSLFVQPMSVTLYEQNAVKPDAAHYYVEIRGAE